MEGIVIKAVAGSFTVSDFDNNFEYICKARGKLAYTKDIIKVGERVIIDEKEGVITKILPHKNSLIRPLVSNIDKMFLVTSVKEPELNLYLLDKMIALYEYYDIIPVLLFTKLDLLDDKTDFNNTISYYKKIGYNVYLGENKTFEEKVKDEITGCVCSVSGQTGVGKSSFMNFLDPLFKRKTDEISDALGRGKHTTREATLFRYNGGWIADTPGFGNIDFPKMEENDLTFLFKDFKDYSNCKYNNCLHINEPRCAIIEGVNEGKILKSRYENYLKFIEEIRKMKTRY